jgi:hypothetical protein
MKKVASGERNRRNPESGSGLGIVWVHPGVFAKSAQTIEKIEDELPRTAKERWKKNLSRKELGVKKSSGFCVTVGIPTPRQFV